MDTRQLEELLTGTVETQTLEFKSACDCAIDSLTKDILALANVQDGGHIVIGVKDQTYEREGLSETQLSTYDADVMLDRANRFADPHVAFDVYKPHDEEGKSYVVIRVHGFTEVPIVTKKENGEIKKGVLYYRNRNGRPQSAPVSNSYDLRDIVDRATVLMMQRRRAAGYDVLPSQGTALADELDDELGDL